MSYISQSAEHRLRLLPYQLHLAVELLVVDVPEELLDVAGDVFPHCLVFVDRLVPAEIGEGQKALEVDHLRVPPPCLPLPALRKKLEDLEIARHHLHLLYRLQHQLVALPLRNPLTIGQLLDVQLNPVGLGLVQLAQQVVDGSAVDLLVEGKRILQDACEPTQVIVDIVLHGDLLSQPRNLYSMLQQGDLAVRQQGGPIQISGEVDGLFESDVEAHVDAGLLLQIVLHYIMSVKISKGVRTVHLLKGDRHPFHPWTQRGVGVQAADDEQREGGGEEVVSVGAVSLWRLIDALKDLSLGVDLFVSGVAQVKDAAAEEDLRQNDSQGEDVLLLGKLQAILPPRGLPQESDEDLGSDVGEGEARGVIQVMGGVLLAQTSRWQAYPQSMILVIRPAQTMMLMGLRSRWMMLYSSKCLTPCSTLIIRYSLVHRDMVSPLAAMQKSSSSPSIISISKQLPSSLALSIPQYLGIKYDTLLFRCETIIFSCAILSLFPSKFPLGFLTATILQTLLSSMGLYPIQTEPMKVRFMRQAQTVLVPPSPMGKQSLKISTLTVLQIQSSTCFSSGYFSISNFFNFLPCRLYISKRLPLRYSDCSSTPTCANRRPTPRSKLELSTIPRSTAYSCSLCRWKDWLANRNWLFYALTSMFVLVVCRILLSIRFFSKSPDSCTRVPLRKQRTRSSQKCMRFLTSTRRQSILFLRQRISGRAAKLLSTMVILPWCRKRHDQREASFWRFASS